MFPCLIYFGFLFFQPHCNAFTDSLVHCILALCMIDGTLKGGGLEFCPQNLAKSLLFYKNSLIPSSFYQLSTEARSHWFMSRAKIPTVWSGGFDGKNLPHPRLSLLEEDRPFCQSKLCVCRFVQIGYGKGPNVVWTGRLSVLFRQRT